MWKNSNSKILPLWRASNVNRVITNNDKSDYFFSLDDKSKQICKVKTNNIQRYDPYHIKKE